MKFDPKGWAENARLKFGVWKRERAERKAERQAQAYSEHGHGRFFLLTVPAVATILAAVTEWYWAILFCIEATGAIDWNYETAFGSEAAAASVWNFAFSTHWPVFIGLICATIPIVMFSMVWLPVQFAMRGTGRIRRGSIIVVGLLANILVIVSGTVVMNYNRQDQVRDAVVIEQTAAQGRAAIDARLAFEQEQLRLALANTNPYLNQAANVGAEEWERSYVAQARASNDPRLPQLERALGAARAADARRANIERLTIERATAAPEAASAANVTDTVGAELNTFAQYVEVWRPPFIALICTLIGIFGTWWVIAMLEKMNPRDVLRSGWADEGHRIEDLRSQPSVVPEPMQAAREAIYDAETGEELTHVRATWRKKPKRKGKPERIETTPDIPPDETGVRIDGGNRIAVGADGLGGVMESAAQEGGEIAADAPEQDSSNEAAQGEPEIVAEMTGDGPGAQPDEKLQIFEHPEPSLEMSEEDVILAYGETSVDPEELSDAVGNINVETANFVDENGDEPAQDGDASQDAERQEEPIHHNAPREPEQNTARLIAPVAAE